MSTTNELGWEEMEKGLDWTDWAREQTDPRRASAKPEALRGLRVLDVSHGHIGGLFCSSILAVFGAEVIRIEPPGGDPARKYSPFALLHKDTGLGYLAEGQNKFHITLNLEQSEGREIFRKLARNCDVVLETFKPGVMDGWGIGYRQLREENPRLIYAALYTYGQFGPKAACGQPDHDVANQVLSGIVFATGEMATSNPPEPFQVPTKVGSWVGWYAGGAWAAFGILAALHFRHRTGKGQFVDVSGAEGVMRFVNYNVVWYHTHGRTMERVGNMDLGIYPYGIVECKDGYVFLAGFSDINFHALVTIMERPELEQDPRFDSFLKRPKLEHMIQLKEELEKWSRNYTAEEILEKVLAYRGEGIVATARANTPSQTLAEDHWWQRGIFQLVDDPVYGKLLIQAPPWKMTETPPRITWLCRPVGADNEFVYLKYLGYGREQLEALREKGVV